MDDLVSTLILLKSTIHTSDQSCFSEVVEAVWERDPEMAFELLGELTKQGKIRRATTAKAAVSDASSDQAPLVAFQSAPSYVNAGTQTSADANDSVKPRGQRKKQDDLAYRPSHSTPKYTKSEQTQRNSASDKAPSSQPQLPSRKSPASPELPTSPESPTPQGSPASPESSTSSESSGNLHATATAKPESMVILDTSPESENDLTKAPQEKALAAASPPLTTILSLVSEEAAMCMIFDAARDIYDMEVYEGQLGGEVHQEILDSLKCDHTNGVVPRLVSQPMGWSLTMWMNILDQGRASHKKIGILRKIEWMGASAWFDSQVEQTSNAPPKTKRGIPMKRVSTVVLDRLLNEARNDDGDTSSMQPIDRKAQQRKNFVDICTKGKKLRQIVKVLGTGVLFYRRIWDLIKIAQHQVEDVVSHLSTNPAKACVLALLGEQVELLVENGRPSTAAFLDAVEAKSLISEDDVASLRLDYGVSKSDAKLSQHIDHLKVGIHQILGKRQLDNEDTVTLSGKSIPGDSFNRLAVGEWFDIWLLEAALEIQDRPAWVKVGPCISTHEVVHGKVKPIEAPFRRLKIEIESSRDGNSSQRPQDGFIFLRPLCVNTNHFTLLEVNERESMIYHYDSLSNRQGSTRNSGPNAVQEELKSLGFNYADTPTPQQHDFSSCGPMVVRNATLRMSGQSVGDWDDQLDPIKMRASIVRDLQTCVSYCGVDPDIRRSKRLRST